MSNKEIRKENSFKNERDVIWAFFLLFIGTIFLLNTTGIVGWNIWSYIFRFWPIFLIIAGIKLMIGKSAVSEVVLSIVAIITFVSVGLFSYLLSTSTALPFLPEYINRCMIGNCREVGVRNGNTVEENFVVKGDEYTDVEQRILDLKIGAAEFTVEDEESTNYLNIDTKYSNGYYDPSLTPSFSNGILSMRFDTINSPRFGINFDNSAEFDFKVGLPEVKTDLKVDLGAGEGTVTLNKTTLSNIDANVGAGKLRIDLSENSIPSGDVKLSIGAGEVVLLLPQDVAFEISYNLGIGEISYNGKEIAQFAGEGNGVKSDNYEGALKVVRIDANVGVGSLNIESK